MTEQVEAEIEDLRGAFVAATVTDVAPDHVKVRLEGDAIGTIPAADFGRGGPDVAVGDAFSVYVEQPSREGYLVSKDKAERMAALDRIGAAYEAKEIIEGVVVAASGSGYTVDVGVRAFCPGSQFSLRPIRDPEEVLGQTFRFKVSKFQHSRQNVVLSRRRLLEKERDKLFGRLKVGALVDGTVRRFADFGAFVDIGGIDGLLHVDDLSWGRVRKPSDVVSIGDELTLKVLKFDKKSRKVSLGLRQCQDDPWLEVADKYPIGTAVQGQVVAKTDYGCFIEVAPGVEGLVHITGPAVTDTAKKQLEKTDIGDELKAQVIAVDAHAKRMSLALDEA